jgi:cellulose synthase/poly-beta-1,6-N-acetylglucosamine synthase-like glycosyltransferase
MAKVTICLPVYNCEDSIDAAIGSALQQSFTDFECLVVDNASTDSTIDHVMAFDDPRVRVIRNSENVGPNANHNICIQHARGDLIQFLHGDDLLLRDCLACLVPTFDDPRVGLAFARRRIQSTDYGWSGRFADLQTPLEPLDPVNDGVSIIRKYVDNGSKGNWIGEPTSVMVRKSLLMEVGGFSPELLYSDDMDLWLRILARSHAAWVDSELSVRTQDETTLTILYAATDAAWLDRLWILTGLACNRDLDRKIRLKARWQWVVAVLKKAVRAQQAPRGLRRMKNKQLSRHIWLSLNGYSRSNIAPGAEVP